MSSMDDSSLISGISKLSPIPKASNSTSYKLDSTCNISEWRSMCRVTTKSFSTDSQKNDPKSISESLKVIKALSTCEESTCDYAKLKLIYQCLEEIAFEENDALEQSTMIKIKELITIHEVKKHLHLPNNTKDLKEELTLLGIIDLPKHDFTYKEQIAIKSCLEANLRTKIHKYIAEYERLEGSTKTVLKNNESLLQNRFQHKGELDSIHWKEKIDEVCLEYRRDLLHCLKLLKQWNELEYKMKEKNTKGAENLLLQAEIAEMKAIITKLSCIIRMYKETPVTVDALRILNESLDEKIACISEEVSEKTELKKAYEALNGTEYDEILRKYLELCHIVKKKKNLLDKL